MFYRLFAYVLEELVLIWGTIAFLRFFFQRGGMRVTHPFAEFSMKSTQWIVGPMRKLVKPIRGWDAAIVASVFVFAAVARYLVMFVKIFVNTDLFSPEDIILEVSNAAFITSKSFAYALIFIMAYRWIARRRIGQGIPMVEMVNYIYKTVMRPFGPPGSKFTSLTHVAIFVLLILWVLVVAQYLQFLLMTKF